MRDDATKVTCDGSSGDKCAFSVEVTCWYLIFVITAALYKHMCNLHTMGVKESDRRLSWFLKFKILLAYAILFCNH